VLKIIGALAAEASAVCWITAALIRTPLLIAYLSGPPPEIAERVI
jgi:hypothetical protein